MRHDLTGTNEAESKETPKLEIPFHQAIALRAYELWVQAGCADGEHEQHWLRAEEELKEDL